MLPEVVANRGKNGFEAGFAQTAGDAKEERR